MPPLLNKSGGIRDSSSFEANVSEVVKLYRQENNAETNQFIFEWTKSRSGLNGQHFLVREPSSYGWFYKGPVNGGVEGLNNVVGFINDRPNERFDKRRVAHCSPHYDVAMTGRLLEQARRQGLIASSFNVGPNGERERVYHSWDYKETIDFEPSQVRETVAANNIVEAAFDDEDDGIPF